MGLFRLVNNLFVLDDDMQKRTIYGKFWLPDDSIEMIYIKYVHLIMSVDCIVHIYGQPF